MERLVVSSIDHTIRIDDEVLRDYFELQGETENHVIVNGLMNLKKAHILLDLEIIKKAAQVYSSTRSAAEILGIDHSTIARKAKKYGINFQIK